MTPVNERKGPIVGHHQGPRRRPQVKIAPRLLGPKMDPGESSFETKRTGPDKDRADERNLGNEETRESSKNSQIKKRDRQEIGKEARPRKDTEIGDAKRKGSEEDPTGLDEVVRPIDFSPSGQKGQKKDGEKGELKARLKERVRIKG